MITEKIVPRGFVARPPTMEDAGAVTRLTNMYEIAVDGEPELAEDELRSAWGAPDFDLASDAWLVLSPEGEIVGAAELEHRQHVKVYLYACVHPEYQGRGIGSYLLGQAEARARRHVDEATPGFRVTLNAHTSSRDAAAQRLLNWRGFRSVRCFWNMAIELKEAPPTARWAEGITVCTMSEGRERAVYEAKEETFQDHWGHIPESFEDWMHRTVKREGFDRSLWFLAMDGDEIAGIALCEHSAEQGGWVNTLGVRRRWRRKGIGLALLHHAFAEFHRRGVHRVLLGVDAESLTGATKLYERAGMHVTKQIERYEKELRAGKEPSTQFVSESAGG